MGKANPLDLRNWLADMEEEDGVQVVRGADWNLEIGAISELNVKKTGHKALLFDDIPGYPAGYRVLTCTTSSPSRLASLLRAPKVAGHHELVQWLRGKPKAWAAQAEAYPPVSVSTGPVMACVDDKDAVNLYKFPAPLWHELDGGRYIGTGCAVVTKDRDSDWVNVGTYRIMVQDETHVGLDMVSGKHGQIQFQKYMAAGEPFPVCIVIGADPLCYLISGIEVPYGISEFNYMGAILEQPVEVVHGERTGLPFPAGAEIVLEGWIYPGDERLEGPFGEFHGYYQAGAKVAPLVTVERVYYRRDPIIVGSPPAKPPNDYSYSKAVMRSALLFDALVSAGVPGVESVWAHEIGGARMFTVASIRQRYAGHARQCGHVLSQCGVAAYMGRYSVVVDEDIDPSNLTEVMWAIATRTDPEKDIDFIRNAMGSKNDPMSVTYTSKAMFSSRAIIDACRPFDHLDDFPPVAEASPELQAQVREKWRDVLPL
ncbi:UbiD family decarboxylase [Alicyclobacillus cycloheptanicus]|uniref:UbiD family decarboxylase n=1 Tax=Alicyclobacillus cycloheptanicus TaxID=1457 RepID=A0ABT9XFH9_9BACL|nr:UbiD family decarboxylase [Alicyclobacillus cycloheptanicus]MDQ0189058.1 UbiD family decarboxylase [Alicyclobacillus cycloheptanicus]WDM00194.1 UbiD family decarboxylase [Alicyclobacillus cycloheptanicus]